MTSTPILKIPRLTIIALALFALMGWGFAYLYFSNTRGHLDFQHHAVGRDFINVWMASRLTLQGHVVDVFSPARYLAAAHAQFDQRLPLHFWSYPPTALFTTLPFGAFDYLTAYGLWTVASLIVLLAAARTYVTNRTDLCLLMASPAVATNLVMGQNGCLTAALLFCGLSAFDSRPRRAGFWFGLLTFKPQLGLLIPVAVLASPRRWTMLAMAGAVGLGLVALSIAVFGVASWQAFFRDTAPMQSTMMTRGVGPMQWMSPSAFMSGRVLNLPLAGVIALQAPFTAVGVWLAWRAYRSSAEPALKSAQLMVATFLASPQSFNYDLIPLAAAALVLARGPRSLVDSFAAVLIWIVPIAVIPLNFQGTPIAPCLIGLAAWRLEKRISEPRTSLT